MTLRRPGWLLWTAWHAVVLLGLAVAVPRLRYGAAWATNADTVWLVGGLTAAFMAGAFILSVRTARRNELSLAHWFACIAPPMGLLLLGLNLSERSFSRSLLVAGVAAYPLAMLVPLVLRRRLQTVALVGAAGGVVASIVMVRPAGPPPPSDTTTVVRSRQLMLLATYHRNYWDSVTAVGGGLATFGDGYLLARADGELYRLTWDSTRRALSVTNLPHRVPMNRAAMLAAGTGVAGARTDVFRTGDVLIEQRDSVFDVFVSHHYWNDTGACVVVRVSATSGTAQAFASATPLAWRTVYESRPCLPLMVGLRNLAAQQMGGVLARLNHDELLLTLGDHGFDGVRHPQIVSQSDTSSYGKIIRINVRTGVASTYSRGHRNPQGLLITSSGIWETEHGPAGGDELNRIVEGKNYGWPLVTLGSDYEVQGWPLSATPGRHDGYEGPVYAWRPSIGITTIVQIRQGRFADWRDDFVIGAMGDQAIWRVRLDGERVTFAERIDLAGNRVRDMIEDKSGRLVLLVEGAFFAPTTLGIVVLEPVAGTTRSDVAAIADPVVRGEVLFASCAGCHAVERDEPRALGPSLRGVFERDIASSPSFSYSDALRGLSGRWTEAALDSFIANPAAAAPGTAMILDGVKDANARADIIAYLRSLR